MEILEKISIDLKGALKAREGAKVQTLRYILAQVHNREIEKKSAQGGILNDEEVVEVLRREAKKRKEALEIFRKNGREDLAGKEEAELKYFEPYLPKAIDASEIEAAVSEVISRGGSALGGDFGSVMKEVMAKFKGQADGKVVSELVKKKMETK